MGWRAQGMRAKRDVGSSGDRWACWAARLQREVACLSMLVHLMPSEEHTGQGVDAYDSRTSQPARAAFRQKERERRAWWEWGQPGEGLGMSLGEQRDRLMQCRAIVISHGELLSFINGSNMFWKLHNGLTWVIFMVSHILFTNIGRTPFTLFKKKKMCPSRANGIVELICFWSIRHPLVFRMLCY